MKNLIPSLIPGCIIFLILALSCTKSSKNSVETDYLTNLYSNLEFKMDKVMEPTIPDNSVIISDFGAIADGLTLNTKSFADAISQVSEKGGGRIIVPRGIWLTGPIVLKSNIDLHLNEGALILFSRNFNDYPLVQTSFEGLETYRCQSPIYGLNLENVAITGEGIIDGSGEVWRPVKKSKLTESQWKKLISSGGVLDQRQNTWYPSEKALRGTERSNMNVPRGKLTLQDYENIKDFLRPVMVSLVNCNKVLLEGVTFQNSPAWNLHPLMCENVTLRNLTVRNPWYSQNGDGLDLESCRNAVIYKCSFDVGDDGICIKSGKDSTGRARAKPTENVIVKECVVFHGHGGFVVGSEMSGGVRNVHVSNCTFLGTDVGLRFKSTRGRGGVVENIYISNIYMVDIPTEPIHFNLYYGGNSPVPEPDEVITSQNKTIIPPVTVETPQFKNLFIKNILCKGAARAAILQGLPEMNLQNVNIEKVSIEAKRGFEFSDVDGVTLKDIFVKVAEGPAISFNNSKNITIEKFNYQPEQNDAVKITGNLSKDILFKNVGFTSNNVIFGKNVEENTVQFK